MHRRSHLCVLGVFCLACVWMATQPLVSALAQKDESSPQNKSQPPFELRVIHAGNTIQGIRFKPTTGQAWYVSGDRWVPIPETGDVPAGDFEVVLAPVERKFRAFRFDRLTGVAWQLTDQKWAKLKEPE
jgi:hypothetical protein